MSDGISRTGESAEVRFRRITGFEKPGKAALGDACTEIDDAIGYVEVKKCSTNTINQIRPMKMIPLIVLDTRSDEWHVIPAAELVRVALSKNRGQHTELPLESMTGNISTWSGFQVDERRLAERCREEILSTRKQHEIRRILKELHMELRELKERYDQFLRNHL